MKTFAEKENGRETKSKHIFILLASPEDSRKLHIGVKIILVANDRKNNSKQLKQKKRNLLVTDPGSWASVKVVSTCSNDTLFSSLAIRNSSGLENSDNLYLHGGQRVISGFKYGSVFHKLHKKKKKTLRTPQGACVFAWGLKGRSRQIEFVHIWSSCVTSTRGKEMRDSWANICKQYQKQTLTEEGKTWAKS